MEKIHRYEEKTAAFFPYPVFAKICFLDDGSFFQNTLFLSNFFLIFDSLKAFSSFTKNLTINVEKTF